MGFSVLQNRLLDYCLMGKLMKVILWH
ncbi:hypothetical protein Godav_004115, partial [Gossypium davidsonii]|nr:hypothetical protein [Gossypium davidsonii]